MSLRPLRLAAVTLLILCNSLLAANFTCSDQQLVQVGEAARLRSARFWTGTPLPGNWSSPCPIRFKSASHSGGGRTRFQFTNGEVHGWNMLVEGTRSALITDVIPHEVDHMVRASLVRRPIVRWLDEGCASLFESQESHARLRLIARQLDASLMTPVWLTADEYPEDASQLTQLYALGFSLVEYLLEQGGSSQLLQLQLQSHRIEAALQELYGLSLTDLQREWTEYVQTHQERDCLIHHALRPQLCECQNSPQNLLVIWGAHWCGPCHKFWNDYHSDVGFRNVLNEHFHIHFHDFDQQRPLAVQRGIHGVPAFELSDRIVEGYTTPDNLLKQLNLDTASVSNSPEASESIQSANPDQPPSAPIAGHSQQPEVSTLTTLPAVTEPHVVPSDQPTAKPANSQLVSVSQSLKGLIHQLIPISLTALQWSGIIGGSLATGGVGGIFLSGLMFAWKRRTQSKQLSQPSEESRVEPNSAPFPRQLDEARQLLELRKSEGRVAILDALRGMFLDDELEKIKRDQDPALIERIDQLRTAIDSRVEEVAPLSTTVQ